MFALWAETCHLHKPDEITQSALLNYQEAIWQYLKQDGKHLAIGTQIGRLVAVRGFFKWWCKTEQVDADPSAALELPKEPRRLPRNTLSESEVRRILRTPDKSDLLGVRDRAILEVLYSTGIRRMELAHLELPDLHLERRTLLIRSGKGGRDRMVPVGERTMKWLKRYLAVTRPHLSIVSDQPALFLTGYGDGFSPGSLGSLVTKIIKRSGIGRTGSCHLLRHACATHMLERGADVRIIQQLLGHAKLETTAIYTQVSIRTLQEAHAHTHPTANLDS